MKLKFFAWHPGSTGSSNCEIEVPGLGQVNISNCISDETKKRIEDECILALRHKMGQMIKTEPQHVVEAIQ